MIWLLLGTMLCVSRCWDHPAAQWNEIVLLLPFCRWENSGWERGGDFPKLLEHVSDEARMDTHLSQIQSLLNPDINWRKSKMALVCLPPPDTQNQGIEAEASQI